MASGTPVVASRIPALVEVGGRTATYCPVGDVRAWVAVISELLDERVAASNDWQERRAASLTQARRFSWREHARRMTELYRDLLPHIRLVPQRLAASQ
jgi:glycosyltransferase involved in cell wall biosynthesis